MSPTGTLARSDAGRRVTECIALLRGINVGKAKRIAMSDLREIFLKLGHGNVRTLLNSGNVLFDCSRPNTEKLALAVQNSIIAACGFSASVTVVTAANLAFIVRENPLLRIAKDPSRHFVAFVRHADALAPLRSLLDESWKPDALAIGPRAAYLWCADGALESRLSQKFARLAGETVTTRNWATVLKLLTASAPSEGASSK
jgi:uncharacterized protein (DUF1697 family)